jgi:hypothetical protein
MTRCLAVSNRVAMIALVVLSAAGTTPLVAQQPRLTVDGRTPQGSSSGAPLSGPRIRPELRSYEPSLGDSRATARPLLATEGKNHTFVFSTLALVLIGVIVVLLVV